MVNKTIVNKKAFFEKIKAGALASWKKYGVLPSLVAAQAALESDWGRSGLALKGNNLFGIKADRSWRGPILTLPTKEYLNKKWVTVNANWRKYDSWAESVENHGSFFVENKRYKAVLGEKDYLRACKATKAAGYATDPDYANKLISTIKANRLDEWDKEAFGQTKPKTFWLETEPFDDKETAKKIANGIRRTYGIIVHEMNGPKGIYLKTGSFMDKADAKEKADGTKSAYGIEVNLVEF
jgi:flagellum-specific peptidoglycan hydrolase FlgJ